MVIGDGNGDDNNTRNTNETEENDNGWRWLHQTLVTMERLYYMFDSSKFSFSHSTRLASHRIDLMITTITTALLSHTNNNAWWQKVKLKIGALRRRGTHILYAHTSTEQNRTSKHSTTDRTATTTQKCDECLWVSSMMEFVVVKRTCIKLNVYCAFCAQCLCACEQSVHGSLRRVSCMAQHHRAKRMYKSTHRGWISIFIVHISHKIKSIKICRYTRHHNVYNNNK